MKLAMLVNPFTERNLQLAAQVGVEQVVVPYPGLDPDALPDLVKMVEAFGMHLSVIERKLPHLKSFMAWRAGMPKSRTSRPC